MKHCLVAVIAVLSVLLREQLVSSTTEGCPRRYLRRINGKCYYFSVKKLNWYGALNNCLRKGLTLADLSNPGDFNGAVNFLASKGNTEDFWYGANDLQTEGRYQYISNGRLLRYYGNYSVLWASESALCNDCLEIRIRYNLTVVADENCGVRQYFICSERYCDVEEAKPRHHSHEHLHHFHHDIGEPSMESGEDPNTSSPFDDAGEQDNSESEEGGVPDDELGDDIDAATEETTSAGDGAATAADGGDTTAADGGDTTAADGGDTTEAPADGAATAADAGETTEAPADAEATAADAGETTEAPADAEATAADAGETTEAPADGAATAADAGDTTEAPADAAAPAERR